MRIPINVSLFAHILLDSELSGRFGVQGNTFSNTFGYLNQYFKTLPNTPPSIQRLAAAMDTLVIRENNIKAINGSTLDAFTLKTTKEIGDLQPEQNLLIPGGWSGIDSPGHAMIYQFEKDIHGDLLFSIYNSGSGIGQHEKTSSAKKELYSPVKTYKFPNPVDSTELQQLIRRLTVPQLAAGHPARNHRKFDAKEVYTNIETSLEFMKAKLVPVDLSASHATTGSQLSGTCSQRSIHQLLKINFDSLPEYQRFIFDFNMYALKDFITTHPQPRAPEITAFIQKAITNNLRILEEPGVFNDASEQEEVVQAIEDLKQQLQTEKAPMITSFWPEWLDLSPLWNFFTMAPAPDKLTAKMVSFEMPEREELQTQQPMVTKLHKDHLLPELALIIQRCQAQQDSNPAWVVAQIEQAMLELPIPSSCSLAPPYYEKIPLYAAITTAEDFEMIGKALDDLQHLYRHASEQLLKDATLPTQAVTYCSLLALRDYFDATGEAVTGKPAFHSFLHTILYKYLNTFNAYPFLATNNPVSDQRLKALLTLTNHTTSKEELPSIFGEQPEFLSVLDADPYLKAYLESKDDPEQDKDNTLMERYQSIVYDNNLFVNVRNRTNAQEHLTWKNKQIPNPIRYYQSLLDSEPDLKATLENIFKSRQYGDDKLYNGLRRKKLTALYVLLNELDEQGRLKHNSTLSHEEFKPLIKKMQQHFALEKVLVEYLEPLQSKVDGKEFSCLVHGHTEDNRDISPNKTITSSSSDYNWTDKFIDIKYCNYKFPLRPHAKESIAQHKYHFTDSLARSALIRSHVYYKEGSSSRTILDAENSNQIQTFPPDKENRTAIIDKAHYFGRDLFHLRMSPAHQITLTLDYFSKSESLGKLQDPNIQSYVEANLFEPGLLLDALKNDLTFLARFDAFVEKGLLYFSGSDGLLTAESLFFIRLKTYVHRYAALNSPVEEGRHLLRGNHSELNKLIAVEQDPAVLACLHTFRFINAITLHQQEGVDNRLLQEAFFSNFYQQATYNPFTPSDTASLFEQQRARVYFSEWLRDADPELIQSLITPTMVSLGLDVNHLTLTGTYPSFQYQDKTGVTVYTVNAEQGRVFQGDFSFSAIPLDIKRHPITHRLGLQQENSCWISEDENLIRFKSENIRMKREGARLVVQKKWNNRELKLK